MLKIGDFSKLSRCSVRMLRHYDEIGLLEPAEIDRFTGYRYYSEAQLTVIGQIISLRDMGFSLAAIGEMLKLDDPEHVKFRTLPPVTYAGCTFKGSYRFTNEAIAAVATWIEANGYESDAPMFNIYHVSPHETQNPDEFVTEVCFPVRKKQA